MRPLPTIDEMNALPNRKAVYLIYRAVDDHMWAEEDEQWPVLFAWMEALDLERLDTFRLVGILSITRPLLKHPRRVAWAARCCERLRELAPDRYDRLVSGLV